MTEASSLFQIINYYSLWAEHGQRWGGGGFPKLDVPDSCWQSLYWEMVHCLIVQVALLIILLQDQWKKANYDANAKTANEPAKNPKEAHD